MSIPLHLLNKAATVTRPSLAGDSDGQGGDLETFAAHPTSPSILFRYYPASAKDQSGSVVAGREDERITHVGYVLPLTAIARGDRLEVTVDSIRFDVVAAMPPSKAHHIKLMLVEVHADAY